jgi:hypothetical protein
MVPPPIRTGLPHEWPSKNTIPLGSEKHPVRVAIPSTLYGPAFHLEKTVSFDGYNSACVLSSLEDRL